MPYSALGGGVVDDLLHDVQRRIGARVHTGPLLDRLEAFRTRIDASPYEAYWRGSAICFPWRTILEVSRALGFRRFGRRVPCHAAPRRLDPRISAPMLLQASFLQNRIETARSWWQRTWTRSPTEKPTTRRAAAGRAVQRRPDGGARKRLAAVHVLSDASLPDRLLGRLPRTNRCRQPRQAARRDRRPRAPFHAAAEWLLDKFLPHRGRDPHRRGAHRRAATAASLPRLALAPVNGSGAGLPRILTSRCRRSRTATARSAAAR